MRLIFAVMVLIAGIVEPLAAETRMPDGGGFFEPGQVRDELSASARAEISLRLRENRRELQSRNLLPSGVPLAVGAPAFQWPTIGNQGDPGHFGISNFVDHDAANPDSLSDYNCGQRTYDVAGYNHRGVDIFSWPFPWLKMDQDAVKVVAAAPGFILDKDDGNYDRNCSFVGDWNAVYVQHADGSTTWYGHLKNGSLTSKGMGEAVAAGEFLGIMGSSGQSTGPHLHMETYDSFGELIDPYAGVCNLMNEVSWWQSQPDYYEPGINNIATHDAPPVLDNGCGVTETPNFQDNFEAGQAAYFAVYLRDQLAGRNIDFTIFQPDGSVWRDWDHAMSDPQHYAASYWYWWFTLPADPLPGLWTFRVGFEGQQAESTFTIGPQELFKNGFESSLE